MKILENFKEPVKEESKQEPKKDIKELTETIQKLVSEKAELIDVLQRLQADFENDKKRTAKQTLQLKKYVEADLIKKLLPILDNFEMALKNTSNKDEFIKGVELIFSSFFQTLEDLGLKKIESNCKFDPYKHEVLLTQECDKEEGTILEELQKGYSFKDIIIRHSKVKIAKNHKKENGEKCNEK